MKRKPGRKNYIIRFMNINMDFDVLNDDLTDEQIEDIELIVSTMSKDIWIDMTYVDFRGNNYKSKFIKEKTWNLYMDVIDEYISSKNRSKRVMRAIREFNVQVVFEYMYDILDKYNYGYDDVELYIDQTDEKAYTEYYIDNRTRQEI